MADLTTLAAVKAALGITTSADDAIITALIPQVTALIEGECDRIFSSASPTAEFPRAYDSDRVKLARYPITAVTNVWVSTDVPRVYDASTVLVATDVLPDDNGYLIRIDGGYFPAGANVVKVSYTGGFATIPGDIERAAQEVIAVKLMKGKNKEYHVGSVTLGEGNIQNIVRDDITPSVWDVIRRRRRIAS